MVQILNTMFWESSQKIQQFEKRSGHGNLLGRRDLQIVLDKILPIWNLARFDGTKQR